MWNDGKQVRMYRLIYKENESKYCAYERDNVGQEQNFWRENKQELNDKPLNIKFG